MGEPFPPPLSNAPQSITPLPFDPTVPFHRPQNPAPHQQASPSSNYFTIGQQAMKIIIRFSLVDWKTGNAGELSTGAFDEDSVHHQRNFERRCKENPLTEWDKCDSIWRFLIENILNLKLENNLKVFLSCAIGITFNLSECNLFSTTQNILIFVPLF